MIDIDQESQDTESIVFVGISDKAIEETAAAIDDEAATVNTGSFDTYLYSHTYEQIEASRQLVSAPKPSGEQDEAGNNFAEVANDDHKRNDTDRTYIKTPKLFFDTTISAVFRDDLVSGR